MTSPGKDLSYRLTADSRGFERGFKSAEASAAAFERELAKLERQQAAVEQGLADVGTVALGAGAAIAAGLVMATKAAISWESAWTGVAKVVDGTPQQMAALEEEIRGLAQVLPQTHEEIAAVAAAAGQLGIKREDIADFTRVMVDLGTATNLTSEEAAFALARLMNVMQTAPDDVGRLGATIVELGNNSATTEADILTMAARISGAGRTVRLSEADVLAYAAALSSVGIEAEGGGSAISRAFIIIEQAVRSGGDRLELFSRIAGQSAEDFSRAYQQDAARAMQAFIEGLGRMQSSGEDVFGTMERLGMSEILLRDAMLRLAGAGDLVSRSLDIGNRGWEENTALLEEAEARYATVESRIQIARNNINDFAIDLGNTFLPALGEAADLVSALGEVLSDLPGWMQTALATLAAVSAALLLTGGAALVAVPQIAAYKGAIDLLANSQGRLAAATVAANSAMSRAAGFMAGPWGAAITVAIALLAAWGMQAANARARARQLTDTLDEQSGAVTRDTGLWVANELAQRDAVDAAQKLGISAGDLTAAILGEADAIARVNEILDQHQASGNPVEDLMNRQTSAAIKVREAMRELGGDLDSARELYEELTAAQEGAGKTLDDLDPATRQTAQALGITASAAEDMTKAVNDLDQALQALLDRMFGVEAAEDAATRAMQRLTDAADKNGGALRGNSEAALDNRSAVRDVIGAHLGLIQEMASSGATSDELREKTEELRKKFVEHAKQLGLDEKAVADYARAYDEVPALVETTVGTPGLAQAMRQVQSYADWLKTIPSEVRTRMIVEQQTSRGGAREFNYTGGRVGSRFAGGGMADGPLGQDAIPAWLTRGEMVVNRWASERNLAALEAANSGARLAVVGSPRSAAAGGGPTINNTTNVYPAQQVLDARGLDLVMAQQEARQRAGRQG